MSGPTLPGLEKPRFDVNALDPVDPFELDADNEPHLAKHEGCDPELLYSMWGGERLFFRAHGPADWLLVADMGGEVFFAALMSPRYSGPEKCRPIGLRRAPARLATRYFHAL